MAGKGKNRLLKEKVFTFLIDSKTIIESTLTAALAANIFILVGPW